MSIAESIIKIIDQYNLDYAYIMMYFYDRVVMGKINNKKPLYTMEKDGSPVITEYCFDDSLCYEIHIFNKEMELRWHKVDESSLREMKFILIKDPVENRELGTMYLEEKMFITGSRGERTVKKGENCVLIEQYGREVILPFEVADERNNDLRLVVHHFFTEDGSVSGYRLVDIEGGVK